MKGLCDSCDANIIQGTLCHEHGCPVSRGPEISERDLEDTMTDPSDSVPTPGPWAVERRFSTWAVTASSGDVVYVPFHFEHEGRPSGSVLSQQKTAEELEANAHLIASAPELLAALEGLVAEHDEGNDNQFWSGTWSGVRPDTASIILARAAIARAKGDA